VLGNLINEYRQAGALADYLNALRNSC
jgi:hypothetical protein